MKNRGIIMIVVCAFAFTAKAQDIKPANASDLQKVNQLKRAQKQILIPVEKPDNYSIVKEKKKEVSHSVEFNKPLRDPKRKPLIARERLRK